MIKVYHFGGENQEKISGGRNFANRENVLVRTLGEGPWRDKTSSSSPEGRTVERRRGDKEGELSPSGADPGSRELHSN